MDELYQRALMAHPSDLMLNHDYAWSLTNQKRHADAIPYYRACIAIRPEVAGIWRCLGIALRETGKADESIAALEESSRRQPGHAATLVDLGISLLEAERIDDAVATLNEAIQLKPELAAAHGYLGRALQRKGQIKEALLSLEHARDLGKRDVSWPMPIETWIGECEGIRDALPTDGSLPVP
ncbi:MAG: tetratricopeptide repeat protein [Planctomycetes bacterium]|nr:tetratricopeptide repeat protein [Planctomycetota bacterium]